MLVGIIAANSLWLSPYAFYYTKLLDELGMDYEVVAPRRNPDVPERYEGRLKLLPWDIRMPTVLNYIRYAHAVKREAVGTYDFLIVLTTNNAVFCGPWLKRYFDHRYLVDIRDYTHENHPLFYALERRSLHHAACRVISSANFRRFLPAEPYLCCHNISTPPQPSAHSFSKASGPIVVGYIGSVSYAAQCMRFMELVRADSRFAFHVYGRGPDEAALRAYGETLSCPRIRFFGAYQPAEKPELLQKVDILFNAYGNDSPLLRCALSNKLYDALYYRKPLLTSPDTAMTDMGGSLAFAVDLQRATSLDALWSWYQALEPEAVNAFAAQQFEALQQEHQATGETIQAVLRTACGSR